MALKKSRETEGQTVTRLTKATSSEKFSSFLEWTWYYINSLEEYLGDFSCMGASCSGCCALLLLQFMKFICELGVPLAEENMEGNHIFISFLDI